MSDAKKDYSDAVTQKKREALEDGVLTKIFRRCFKRGELFEKIGGGGCHS